VRQLSLRLAPNATAYGSEQALWIAANLPEPQSIRVGMTRGELLKVFMEEGGFRRGCSDVRFVYPPGTLGWFQFPAAALVQFRRVPLYPTPNCRVVSRETSLGQKFFDVTIREGISQIPTNSAKNDRWFEVSPF